MSNGSKGVDVSKLRDVVGRLAQRGRADLISTRQAFASGIPPLQTVGSGSVSSFIAALARESGSDQVVRSTGRLGVFSSAGGTSVLPPRPELDHAEVGSDSDVGVLDPFFVRVTLSIPISAVGEVAEVRLLRAFHGSADAPRPSFSAMFENPRSTLDDVLRIESLGVGSVASLVLKDDPARANRTVISSGTLRLPPATKNTNRPAAQGALITIPHADPAVLENVLFATNQAMQSAVRSIEHPLEIGRVQGINVMAGSGLTRSGMIVEPANSAEFREVARRAPSGRSVGDLLEMTFVDPAVVYGSALSYYVTCLDREGREGPRSRIVRVDVVRAVPPQSPRVTYSVIAGIPRFSVECPGRYLDHVEVFRRGGSVPETVGLVGRRTAITDSSVVSTESGFSHVADLALNVNGSAVMIDHGVRRGDRADYRFYAVDTFGYKSQTPFSCSVLIPSVGGGTPLALPSITAEQNVGGRTVRVSVACDDDRVGSLIIRRREIGIGENSFHQPSVPDRKVLGNPRSVKRMASRTSPTLNQDSKKAWTGVISGRSGTMMDTAVQWDRIYQYSVEAVDLRGIHTDSVRSESVLVSMKPVVDPPVSLEGSFGEGGVVLTWSPGTLDFSPGELVGDQDVLSATSVRTVFQVERRSVGDQLWRAMPATTESWFVDRPGAVEQKFRPLPPELGRAYEYRVIAMQSGGFISTYTDPVRVDLTRRPDSVGMIWVRMPRPAARPATIVVSWNYVGSDVDLWEIERAAPNKLYAARILAADSADARSLTYVPVARIPREASRARMVGASLSISGQPGNRLFLDTDVDHVNSYFYRIRAVSNSGEASDWSYAGITLSDSAFDRKLDSVLSDDERVSLSVDPRTARGRIR